jgi:hypothetical protein
VTDRSPHRWPDQEPEPDLVVELLVVLSVTGLLVYVGLALWACGWVARRVLG